MLDGAVYDHKLSLEREEAVLDRGVQLGLPDTVVEQYIEDYLTVTKPGEKARPISSTCTSSRRRV